MFKELIQVTLSDIWNYVEYTGRKHAPLSAWCHCRYCYGVPGDS